MEKFIINPEFRDLIPPQSADEHQRLEENILEDGEVREPLVVWGNTIIDGHNRWKIIQKHPNLHYEVKQMDFPDKWAVRVWICKNQLGRRNLNEANMEILIGEAYKSQKMTQGAPAGNNNAKKQSHHDGAFEFPASHQDDNLKKSGKTKTKIAKDFSVGTSTVERAEHYVDGLNAADEVSPGFRDDVRAGKIKAPKTIIREIRNTPEEKRPAAVQAIKEGKIDEAKEIIMNKPKKEIKDETLKKVIDDLYDTNKVIEHTVDDFLEDLDAMITNFASMMRRSVSMKADWCKTDEEKERVRAKLSEVDAVIEELRGKMA